jgi:adenine-specific DNA-methyltransferase
MKSKSLNSSGKEKRGVVYTPSYVARHLASWAIRSSRDVILDPCVGLGVFVDASRERLVKLGATRPQLQIFGVDRDPDTKVAFRETGGVSKNFRSSDFFSLTTSNFPRQFSVILANPPYVRHHDLSRTAMKRAAAAISSAGYKLPQTANYWAYFVLHSLQFLESGGRLAFVLPGSVLHSDFAAYVRRFFHAQFEKIQVVALDECIFDRVQEEAVLVLAENKWAEKSRGAISVTSQSATRIVLDGSLTESEHVGSHESWSEMLLSDRERAAYQNLLMFSTKLGDSFDVRIGTVTGSNSFFLRSASELESLPDACWIPAISKSRQLRGLCFTAKDWDTLNDDDAAVYLAKIARRHLKSSRVRDFVEKGERVRAHKTSHAQRRQPWHNVPLTAVPDAFLTCMSAISPAVIVNEAKVRSTNTIHGLYRRKDVKPVVTAAIASLAFATSLAQLGAELEGRGYGGGVLKIEPSGARRIPIPRLHQPIATDTIELADRLRREQKFSELALLADAAFFDSKLTPMLDLVRNALERMRHRRHTRAVTRNRTDEAEKESCG